MLKKGPTSLLEVRPFVYSLRETASTGSVSLLAEAAAINFVTAGKFFNLPGTVEYAPALGQFFDLSFRCLWPLLPP